MSTTTMRRLRGRAYRLALAGMFRMDPERIHGAVGAGLSLLQAAPPAADAMRRLLGPADPLLRQRLFGVDFPAPLGLAAGFDKAGRTPDVWSAVGFGYAELGTVTAEGQPGNPAPRLFRLPEDHALLNRMGFNNPGADAVAANLRRRRRAGDVVGVNIGKTKATPLGEAEEDYRRSAALLGPLADYLVVNVSSPNTPGLRDLQSVTALRPILAAVREATETPVLVKIAPDLADEDVDAVADLAVESELAGIVATNTTISRKGLRTGAAEVAAMGAGGISGPPVARRSLEVLRRLHHRVGGELTLISVGGISGPRQAWERIAAGAHLLQGYTGLIYGGPDWIRDIHRGIAAQLRRHGHSAIGEAVGRGGPWIGAD